MAESGCDIQLVLDAKTDLGESPAWDARSQRLYFVDIYGKSIHIYDPATKEHVQIDTPELPGTVVPTSNPDVLLAAFDRTAVEVNVPERKLGNVIATVPGEHGVENMRFNDGKASPNGVLVVGRMHGGWREGKAGRLYRLDADAGEFVEVLGPSEVVLPNGMAWDEAKGLLYFVDSGAGTITAYPCDATGAPAQPDNGGQPQGRRVVTIPKTEGVPDGMTIDSQGRLWVALGEGGAVACYDAGTGEQLQKIKLPIKRPTACTFGGADLDELFVTTRTETGESASPHWGGIFSVRIPGVTGQAGAYAVKLPQ